MRLTNIELESIKHYEDSGWSSYLSVVNNGKTGAPINEWITENNTTDIDSMDDKLLERIIGRNNLATAFKRVKANKGCAGVDGMEVDQLYDFFRNNVDSLRQSIIIGKYKPSPVLRVEIPKENGKKRLLGIPTAVDRVIQQAIAQVLMPIYEPKFVDTSYGFRPKRSAHDAIRKCLEYLNEGYTYTVDMDLERFFDTVNQSKLIQILSEEIKDGRVISLIHKYLRAGVVVNGKYQQTTEGLSQGSSFSPILANIMLNELDHELERRGHKFVRYADDMVIFCKSKASAKQTLAHILPYIEKKLFLKVNQEKTVVAYASKIKFLGYGFYLGKDGYGCCVHKKSKAKLKDKVRELTKRNKPISKNEWQGCIKLLIRGWVNYYKLANMKTFLINIDAWLRRRIRMIIWKRWKRVRTRYRAMRKLGLTHVQAIQGANSRCGYWVAANSPFVNMALSNCRLKYDGFDCFLDYYCTIRMGKQR